MREYKYLFGSKLLKLSNTRDEDWLIYADAPAKKLRKMKEAGETNATHSISLNKAIIQHFLQKEKVQVDPFKALSLFQESVGFFPDDPEYIFRDFNILEHKAVWILWLKAFINSEEAKTMAQRSEILDKRFYYLLYQYHMIKENAHWISEEAMVNVQKIHDLEMPSSYFEELKSLINSL